VVQEPVTTATLPPLATAERVDLVCVIDGTSTARELPPAGRVVIGRGASSAVCVPHRSVSREHAALTLPELVLEDLGSTNGTFVCTRKPDGTIEERRLDAGQPAALVPGATVRLGAVTFVLVPTFVRGEEPTLQAAEDGALEPRNPWEYPGERSSIGSSATALRVLARPATSDRYRPSNK